MTYLEAEKLTECPECDTTLVYGSKEIFTEDDGSETWECKVCPNCNWKSDIIL